MELKTYQRRILKDLENYLDYIDESDYISAYDKLWNSQQIRTDGIGQNSMPGYQDIIKKCPNVCLKVPTAGGKTFIACNALKPIFDHMQGRDEKVVVWFVPGDVILNQTIKNLSDPGHPYRQKLDSLFNGSVEIFTKQQLLQGAGFNPSSIKEQISILVLSFDSFRANNKEGRKVYQENGYLAQFTNTLGKDSVVEDADETSLVNILNKLSPVVVIDESHRAKTELSFNALNDLNPSFVLELTATPRKESNIISVATAFELKKEQMVKLPVVAYNMQEKKIVIQNTISFQRKLENLAKQNEENGGRYIRPIVILQAQQKGSSETAEDIASYNKVREHLIDLGIPADQIAIQTATIKDLTGVDLLSRECPIRFIITINALKEGWDCPFAYILASLANRKSSVDVEQLLGRILRQPYTQFQNDKMLNFSYVFTASEKFTETLQNIIKELGQEGFGKFNSRSDRIEFDDIESEEIVVSKDDYNEESVSDGNDNIEDENDFSTEDINISNNNEFSSQIEQLANRTNIEFEKKLADDDVVNFFGSGGNDCTYSINMDYAKDIQQLPQFYISLGGKTLFGESDFDKKLLESEDLLDGFNLNECETKLTFEDDNNIQNIQIIDIEKVNGEAYPRYKGISDIDTRKKILNYVSQLPQGQQKDFFVNLVMPKARAIDSIDDNDLKKYIGRVIEGLDADKLEGMKENPGVYAKVIEKKIKRLMRDYEKKQLAEYIRTGKVFTEKSRTFPQKILITDTVSGIQKSLYTEESSMNGFEMEVISKIANSENVVRWHRINDKNPTVEYCINGAFNHYPDFVVYTTSGKILMIETKGDNLDNSDSKDKIELGNLRSNASGQQNFQYYMLFKDEDKINGAYGVNEFLELLKKL